MLAILQSRTKDCLGRRKSGGPIPSRGISSADHLGAREGARSIVPQQTPSANRANQILCTAMIRACAAPRWAPEEVPGRMARGAVRGTDARGALISAAPANVPVACPRVPCGRASRQPRPPSKYAHRAALSHDGRQFLPVVYHPLPRLRAGSKGAARARHSRLFSREGPEKLPMSGTDFNSRPGADRPTPAAARVRPL